MRTIAGARAAGRRGSAIVFALVILTSLMLLSAAFHHLTSRSAREVEATIDDRRAFHLADAALAEAMIAVRSNAPGLGAVGSQANPAYLGDGVLWVTSTDLGGGRYQLVATALAGSGRSAIEAVVELEPNPLFDTVLNSREQLTLNSDVVIDSFDSMVGTYAAQATNFANGHTYANDNGDVASTQDIILNSNATVFGDAIPGPGYSVNFAAGSFVSGATTPGANAFAFPPIVVPTVASAGPYTLSPNSTQTLPSGKYGFDDFTLSKSSTLTIQGPAVVVVNNFTGGKDAQMIVDASNGPVTFFVQGSYSHISGFECLPTAGSPMALAFMVEGSNDVVFPSGINVRGAYYAPNANVVFGAMNEAWGSFGANRIDMSNAMKFHFDESLAKYWQIPSSMANDPLHLLAWSRTEVQPALMRDRSDPYQLLGVVKGALLSPSQSW